MALKLKTSLFTVQAVRAYWKRDGHAEIRGLGKGARRIDRHLLDLVEMMSIGLDRCLISYFKIGN